MKKLVILFFAFSIVFSCRTPQPVVTRKPKVVTKKPVAKKPTTTTPSIPPQKPETSKPTQAPSQPFSGDLNVIYINQYNDIAKEEMKKFGIPASITLAQGILESSSGKGRLAVEGNNHFGIKCHEWNGEKIYHDDDKTQECFRKYDDAKLSFEDHSIFLKNRKHYASLFTLKQEDYKAWATGLKAAGYATDKLYPEKIIGIIEKYSLYQYDKEVLGKSYKPVDYPTQPKVSEVKPIETKPQEVKIPEVKSVEVKTPEVAPAEPALSNKNITHTVVKGDTMYSISKAYNISVEELKNLNNMTDNALSIGQKLIVMLAK